MASSSEPIHSGHFMTSNPHREEKEPDNEDEDMEVDVVDLDDAISVQPLDKCVAKDKDEEKQVTFYKFGAQKTQSIAIDVSLNKLNKCIRVAYMKMTTPKWKDFKGLKLQWKHRIRLNNVIWRAYYMEFRKPGSRKRKSPYCYFSVPDEDTTHTKIELVKGSVMEGMYWKRRMEAVCAQYKRWRAYNSRKRRCCRKRENSCGCEMPPNEQEAQCDDDLMLAQSQASIQQRSMTPDLCCTNSGGLFFDFDDDLDNEFTNQLFEQLNAPFHFPNPKECNVPYANADIMQPGLLSLQPSLEEIMSTDFTDDTSHLVDPVEFANSLAMGGELGTTTNRSFNHGQAQQQQQQSRGKQIMTPPPQQQYSAKEYDAANMLVDYSNQPVQRQQQSASMRRVSPSQQPSPSQPLSSSSVRPAMPTPAVLPPMFPQPLYSQAIHQPQRMAPIGQQQQQRHFASPAGGGGNNTTQSAAGGQMELDTLDYGRTATRPVVSTRLGLAQPASQLTTITTSIASSSSAGHFLAPGMGIDYSLLVAASTSSVAALGQQQAVCQAQGFNSLTGAQQSHQHWSSAANWFSAQHNQQQQQLHGLAPPQSQMSPSAAVLSSLAPAIGGPSSPAAGIGSALLFPRSSSFSSSTQPANISQQQYSSQLGSLTAQQQNGRQQGQSVLAAHLQQQKQPLSPQLLSSLAAPQTTVRQFIMSDLSRYLSQQQSPIGVAIGQQQQSSAVGLVPALSLNSSCNPLAIVGGSGLSPIGGGTPHYSPATTPLSAPILGGCGGFGQQSQQQQHLARQQPQLTSATLRRVELLSPPPFSSPPPPKKSSAPATEQMLAQPAQHQPPQRQQAKSRASFSATQRPTGVIGGGGKRQMQQQQQLQRQYSMDSRSDSANSSFAFRDHTEVHNHSQAQQQPNASPSISPASSVLSLSPTIGRSRCWSGSSHPTSNRRQMALTDCCPSQAMDHHTQSQQQPQTLIRAASRKKAGHKVIARAEVQITDQQQQIMGERQQRVKAASAARVGKSASLAPKANSTSPTMTTLLAMDMDISQQQQQMAPVKEEDMEEKPSAALVHLALKRRHAASGSAGTGGPSSSGSTSAGGSHSAAADSTLHPEERKRILHLNAEKNRRSALKEGFETLVEAIPLVEQTGVKCTNAVVLNRAAQHVRELRDHQEGQQRQLRSLREKITGMNERIALIQSNLPSSSAAGSRSSGLGETGSSMCIQAEQFFDRYKRERSKEDYRFWLMGEVLKPLVHSFAEQIHADPHERDRVAQTARKWLDTHWNAAVLRPIASDTLVRLATASGAFTDQKALSNYIAQQIQQEKGAHSSQ